MFSPEFVAFCKACGDESLSILPEKVEGFLKALARDVKEEYERLWISPYLADVYDSQNKKIGANLPNFVALNLYVIENHIEEVWTLTLYKSELLLKTIVTLINEKNYLAVMIVTRSLMENAVDFNIRMRDATLLFTELEQSDSFRRVIANSGEVIFEDSKLVLEFICRIRKTQESLTGFSIGSRDNEELGTVGEIAGEVAAVKKDNILDMLDLLEKRSEYRNIRRVYELLCEYTHPNKPTNEMFFVKKLSLVAPRANSPYAERYSFGKYQYTSNSTLERLFPVFSKSILTTLQLIEEGRSRVMEKPRITAMEVREAKFRDFSICVRIGKHGSYTSHFTNGTYTY